MLHARTSSALDDAWLPLEPVRVGDVTTGLGTPALFVMVADGDDPVLRVDVYSTGTECFAFQDAIVWRGNLVVGFGGHLHAISVADHSALSIATEPYFGHLYPTQDYLLVASGERLLRMEPDRSILWCSEALGVDGVVVHDPGPSIIRGEGEWDPPGCWRSFAISSRDGRPASDPADTEPGSSPSP